MLTDLGKGDLVLLLELVEQSLHVKTSVDMKVLLEQLVHHIPTGGVVAGLVPDVSKDVKGESVPFINVGYPDEWLKKYLYNDYFSCDPIKRIRLSGTDFIRWMEAFSRLENHQEKHYVKQAREYDIREGITIGAQRGGGGPLSFFSFIGTEIANNGRDHTILRHISPYLHEAMCKVTPTGPAAQSRVALSQREVEVLTWAMEGKTNWEISVILSISERTVKFHIQNVMGKLQASSRAHAVAIALGAGLICS
jgi:DNA-binding CsgD family transcriptional regulator